jgi:2-polyprenyl-3-methyl-5-hydroxy-6-metoxy-1,4-benzoquinol methylase
MNGSTAADYDTYQRLKGWDAQPFMEPTPGDRMFYDHYLGSLDLAGSKVLEIGFGNGNFLGWAKANGAVVYGTEIQEAAIAKAQANGVQVLPLDLAEARDELRGELLIVAAFDVMEHLTMGQNAALLAAGADMLQPGGVLIARFPNGQSPLSLPIQHGDRTHVSVLSIPIVEQMITDLPFDVAYAGEPFRTLTGGALSRFVRHGQNLLRRSVTRLIWSIYGQIPLYANAVVVLRRR